jgi:hypothetical protein
MIKFTFVVSFIRLVLVTLFITFFFDIISIHGQEEYWMKNGLGLGRKLYSVNSDININIHRGSEENN